jgi:LAO/AO transport system kinase
VIERHRAALGASGELAAKRRDQQQDWLWAMIDDGLKQHFLGRPDVARLLPEIEAAVLEARLTPTEGARRLLALLDAHGGGDAAPLSQRARRR